ncbi:MAG TPA: DUF2306 domain-containing protein [Bacteroidia bacterium]|nr:DUF2306 domain-containing protein [Bacteroidia bacterium]
MLEGNQITVDGFEIPSNNPIFLAILSIHILAALTCVVSGVMAMFAKKQAGLHPKSGKVYFTGLIVVFVTVIIIAILRWKEDYHLFILGLISFSCAYTGRKALKNKWKKWSIIHITGMGLSYIFLLIAFYVDNGRFLPVWKDFNPVLYWLLPLMIGIPIIIRTLISHPLSRNYFRKNNSFPQK